MKFLSLLIFSNPLYDMHHHFSRNKTKDKSSHLIRLALDAKMKMELLGKNGENKISLFKMSFLSKRSQRRLKEQNNGFIGNYLLSERLLKNGEKLNHLIGRCKTAYLTDFYHTSIVEVR